MTEPTDAQWLEKIRADLHTHADAAEPVHIFVSDVKALLRIIDRQNAVVEAARSVHNIHNKLPSVNRWQANSSSITELGVALAALEDPAP